MHPGDCHVTVMSADPPENVIVAVWLHGTLASVCVIVTFTDWPGERTPFAGLKVNCTGAEPGDVLVEPAAVQLNWPWAVASSVRVITQG